MKIMDNLELKTLALALLLKGKFSVLSSEQKEMLRFRMSVYGEAVAAYQEARKEYHLRKAEHLLPKNFKFLLPSKLMAVAATRQNLTRLIDLHCKPHDYWLPRVLDTAANLPPLAQKKVLQDLWESLEPITEPKT